MAQSIAKSYRPGSTETCYVNPADPDDATFNNFIHWKFAGVECLIKVISKTPDEGLRAFFPAQAAGGG